MKAVSLYLALCLAVLAVSASAAPTLSVRRLNNQRPIITEKDSVWVYNYNTAYMPVRPSPPRKLSKFLSLFIYLFCAYGDPRTQPIYILFLFLFVVLY